MTGRQRATLRLAPGSAEELDDLEAWIRDARIGGVDVTGRRARTAGDAMGPGLVEALTIAVTATAAFVELVQALHGWLRARRGRGASEVELELESRGRVIIRADVPLDRLIAEARAALMSLP